jgi:superfamily II DNA or RNA helicase
VDPGIMNTKPSQQEARNTMPGPELYPYQAEAVEAIAAALSEGGSGQLHAACRTGKTLMAMRAAERLVGADGLVIVLTPSLALVGQILGDWETDSGIAFQRFAACSDETLADRTADPDADEDTATHAADIAQEYGVEVSTDPSKIAKWVAAEGPRLIVATYQSADRLAAAVREVGVEVGMLICDEAHHLAGRADSHTRQVMDDAILPARRRLYMTATPRIGSWRDDETRVLSMDDESAFGPVLYRYTFARAISEGRLEDFRIAAIGVTSREARDLLSRNDIEFTDGVTMRAAAAQIALARANRDFGMRRAFSFHHRVADAKEFVESLPRTFANLPDVERSAAPLGLHINGAMGHDERKQVMKQLENPPEDGWVIVSNVRCLSEGVDVPALDGVLFADPKQSTVDIVQSASRVLTKHPDAPGLSTIIVPVIVPDPGDDGEPGELDYGEFDGLVRVVRAMSEHDETLIAELNRQRSQIGRDPDGGDGDGVIICTGPDSDDPNPDDIPDPVPGQPYEPIGDPPRLAKIQFCGIPPQFLAEMRLVVLRRTTSEWWERYAEARGYFETHGHLRPPHGSRLDWWIESNRRRHRADRLDPERKRLLDDIGMTWSPKDVKWEQGIRLAEAYGEENGHLRVPVKHMVGKFPLGAWLNSRRKDKRAGRLTSERERVLGDMGMVWDSNDERWQRGLSAATAFRKDRGHLLVPGSHVFDDYPLGRWLENKRWEANAGLLSGERRLALDELGMTWARSVRSVTEQEVEEAARIYAQAVHAASRKPRKYVSAQLGISVDRAAYLIKCARKAGLLDPALHAGRTGLVQPRLDRIGRHGSVEQGGTT